MKEKEEIKNLIEMSKNILQALTHVANNEIEIAKKILELEKEKSKKGKK